MLTRMGPIVAVCLLRSWEGRCRLEGLRDDEEGEISDQDRPTSSESATDDLRVRPERPRPDQGVGQEGASAGDRAQETASTGK